LLIIFLSVRMKWAKTWTDFWLVTDFAMPMGGPLRGQRLGQLQSQPRLHLLWLPRLPEVLPRLPQVLPLPRVQHRRSSSRGLPQPLRQARARLRTRSGQRTPWMLHGRALTTRCMLLGGCWRMRI
jgi:hypothetical protein